MNVLIVEDDATTARTLALLLQFEDFQTFTADLGEAGIDLGKTHDYDLIILDMNLPDMSGMDVLRQLRASKINTPVMILSGASEVGTKVASFSGGADEYLTKPFHKDELIARVHAVIRRSQGQVQSVIKTGEISVNIDDKTAEVRSVRVQLTGKEFQMLELLSLRKGMTLTKEMFLNHLYGGIDEPELKIIDVFICKLRKKLAMANCGQHHIETVWGRGYVLRDPAELAAAA
jgi:two-component system cell cycle response regulator CtrA